MHNKKFKLASLLLFLLLPISVFAYKPARSKTTDCQDRQEYYTECFHECGEDYNSKVHTPKFDTNSSSLTFESALYFLKDNGYDDFIRPISPKCEFDLVYLESGTEKHPNFKNFFYCKFHGSYECKIKSSYPKLLEKEERSYQLRKTLGPTIEALKEIIIFVIFISFAICFNIFLYKSIYKFICILFKKPDNK